MAIEIPRVGTAYLGAAAVKQLGVGEPHPDRDKAYQQEVQRLVDAWRSRVEVASGEEFDEFSMVEFLAVGSRRHVVKVRVRDPRLSWRSSNPDDDPALSYIHLRIESRNQGKQASCGFALDKAIEDPLEDDEEDFESTENWRTWILAPLRFIQGATRCGEKGRIPSSCACKEEQFGWRERER